MWEHAAISGPALKLKSLSPLLLFLLFLRFHFPAADIGQRNRGRCRRGTLPESFGLLNDCAAPVYRHFVTSCQCTFNGLRWGNRERGWQSPRLRPSSPLQYSPRRRTALPHLSASHLSDLAWELLWKGWRVSFSLVSVFFLVFYFINFQTFSCLLLQFSLCYPEMSKNVRYPLRFLLLMVMFCLFAVSANTLFSYCFVSSLYSSRSSIVRLSKKMKAVMDTGEKWFEYILSTMCRFWFC